MARHNEARLMGYLIREPMLKFADTEEKKLLRAAIQIRTLRGSREFGNDHRKGYDEHIVISLQPSLMEFMRHLKKYDIVEIKGNLVTMKSYYALTCPSCEHAEKADEEVAIINPIFIDYVNASDELNRIDPQKQMTREERVERYLRKRIEISNNIAVIGDCVKAPEEFNGIVNYELDIVRKYKIREGDPARRHDYPFVKCYGAIARNDYQYIKKGSRVFIDGFIMSRNYKKECTCPACGHKWKLMRSRNEIVPYSVEYLSRCNEGFEEVNNEVNEGLGQEAENDPE